MSATGEDSWFESRTRYFGPKLPFRGHFPEGKFANRFQKFATAKALAIEE